MLHQWLEGSRTWILWKILQKEVDLEDPTPQLDHVYLGCHAKARQRLIPVGTVEN